MLPPSGVLLRAGERCQLHLLGDRSCRYMSRRGKEHSGYSSYSVLDEAVHAQARHRTLVLDGEIILWDWRTCAPLLEMSVPRLCMVPHMHSPGTGCWCWTARTSWGTGAGAPSQWLGCWRPCSGACMRLCAHSQGTGRWCWMAASHPFRENTRCTPAERSQDKADQAVKHAGWGSGSPQVPLTLGALRSNGFRPCGSLRSAAKAAAARTLSK